LRAITSAYQLTPCEKSLFPIQQVGQRAADDVIDVPDLAEDQFGIPLELFGHLSLQSNKVMQVVQNHEIGSANGGKSQRDWDGWP
jgi:hypothetical protein